MKIQLLVYTNKNERNLKYILRVNMPIKQNQKQIRKGSLKDYSYLLHFF